MPGWLKHAEAVAVAIVGEETVSGTERLSLSNGAAWPVSLQHHSGCHISHRHRTSARTEPDKTCQRSAPRPGA